MISFIKTANLVDLLSVVAAAKSPNLNQLLSVPKVRLMVLEDGDNLLARD